MGASPSQASGRGAIVTIVPIKSAPVNADKMSEKDDTHYHRFAATN